MTVRILCRVPGRNDVVLTLHPCHYERVDFGEPGGEYVYPPHVAIMLLEDETGLTHDPRMHIDEQHPPVVEQLDLGAVAGGAR